MTDVSHEGERLQKVLARCGVGSRRVCEDLIDEGRVTVDGEVAILGRRVDPLTAVIEVDGVLIPAAPGLVHYLLNKPAGVVCTASDPQGRPTVLDLVPEDPRVFTVGRLDAETEGLLILTNDGQLTQLLAHPSFGVEKEYLAEIDRTLTSGALRKLRDGVELEDGMTAPAKVALVAEHLVRIVIHEGRNRQVRRMCEAVGSTVVRLVRTRIGPLTDPTLPPGSWRPLSFDEVVALSTSATTGDKAPLRR